MMFLEPAMRLYNAITLPFLLSLLSMFFLAVTYLSLRKDGDLYSSSSLNIFIRWKSVIRKFMEQSHVFIPANHPHLHYVGRWTPSANHLRRDAAFPGSYVELAVTNTTSVYVVLNNVYVAEPGSGEDSEHEEESYFRHLELQPMSDRTEASNQVSLMVEIEGESISGVERASSILRIADNLNPQKTYKFRITHMGSSYDFGRHNEVFEFEGIWLDKPASLRGTILPINSTIKTTLGKLLPYAGGLHGVPQQADSVLRQTKPIIELVTSEPDIGLGCIESNKDVGVLAEERMGTWFNRLESKLAADIALIPTHSLRLEAVNNTQVAIRDLFFRSGLDDTVHFSRPWPFATYRPTILILQLGFVDFLEFFREKNVNKHSVSKFTNEFVDAYVSFVRTIRANAYPFESGIDLVSDEDGSYIYNSAPSTLPIFLIAPFSSRRQFVTKRLTLHKFVSDALAQVSSTLQAQGDKSTFWIDTTGWLDHKKDFDPIYSDHKCHQSNRLTEAANLKVASLLADHLCPYIKGNADVSPNEPVFGDCAFDRYDNYLGNVYLPKDVELDRAVLERKIEAIKQRFNVAESAGLGGRGENFLYRIKK